MMNHTPSPAILLALLVALFVTGCRFYFDPAEHKSINPYDTNFLAGTENIYFDHRNIDAIGRFGVAMSWSSSSLPDFACYRLVVSSNQDFRDVVADVSYYDRNLTRVRLTNRGAGISGAFNPGRTYWCRLGVVTKNGTESWATNRFRTVPQHNSNTVQIIATDFTGASRVLDYCYAGGYHAIAYVYGAENNVYIIPESSMQNYQGMRIGVFSPGQGQLLVASSKAPTNWTGGVNITPLSVTLASNYLFILTSDYGLYRSSNTISLLSNYDTSLSMQAHFNSTSNLLLRLDSTRGVAVRTVGDSVFSLNGAPPFAISSAPFTNANTVSLTSGFSGDSTLIADLFPQLLSHPSFMVPCDDGDFLIGCKMFTSFGKVRLSTAANGGLVPGTPTIRWSRAYQGGQENGLFNAMGALDVDKYGNTWICDTTKNSVQIFDSNGIFLSKIANSDLELVLAGSEVRTIRRVRYSDGKEYMAVIGGTMIDYFAVE